MKTIILGAGGQLANALQEIMPNAVALSIDDLDISNHDTVAKHDWNDVETVINAAAYTNVDGAETTEGRVTAWLANAQAMAYLTQAANKHGFTLVHISSEYVFDGTAKNSMDETMPLSPLSVYGASKAGGDLAVSLAKKHYLVRTSWVVGKGNNFVRTMVGLGEKGISPTVVSDQIGRLTFTNTLAEGIQHLLTTKAPHGTYNLTNEGEPASWAEVARAVFRTRAFDTLSVTDQATADYFADKPEAAKRPLYSVLNLEKIKATGFVPRDWQTDLNDYLKETRS
jgi:dTDP-4-dehydrorhamnose 3,5-epimerase